MNSAWKRLGCGSAAVVVAVGLAACGGGGNNPAAPPESPSSGATASVPAISVTSFGNDFAAMSRLKGLASQGKGKIGVLLPETTTSARYTAFDAPYLTRAFEAAGLVKGKDFVITNAQGSESTEKRQAESDVTQGATVLLVDPIDSGVGGVIEFSAHSRGVKVIDYDRLTLGGSRDYYVSFDNVKVGELIGHGFVDCVTAWNVPKPNVLVMRGAPTDNNATLYARGYNSVLKRHFDSGEYVKIGAPAGTWEPSVAQNTFRRQYTVHKNINAVVTPNDDTANAIIAYLKTLHIPPETFPTTGQDATLTGLRNILTGYQCGTVYKPIYLEAQAAAALALYLRAGQTPPSGLVNGETEDSAAKTRVPSALLTPVWVTTQNVNDTVIKDRFVSPAQLCAGSVASACKQAGVTG